MPRKSRTPKHQDKVVFWVEIKSEYDNSKQMSEAYTYVKSIIDSMLKKKKIDSDRLFIGGEKHSLYVFLSSLIENFKYKDVHIEDFTDLFERDIDFE